jgi:hypothetical protein
MLRRFRLRINHPKSTGTLFVDGRRAGGILRGSCARSEWLAALPRWYKIPTSS